MQQIRQNIPEAQRANPFRRAWNHLTDWEKSPVIKTIRGIRERRIHGLLEEFKSGGRLIERDPFLGNIVDHGAERKLLKMGKYSVPALNEALNGSDKALRGKAARMLGEIEDARALPALILALKDDDIHVMTCVRNALAKKGKPAIHALNAALGNEDPEIRAHAAWAISGMVFEEKADGLEPTIPALIGLLGDGNHEVRISAADALRHVGDSSAIEPLYGLITGEDSFLLELRPGEFSELVKNGDPEAGKVVRARALLMSAMLALSDIAKRHPDHPWEPMLPGLMKPLDCNDAWLQQVTAKALGTIAESHPEYKWDEAAPKVARTLCVDRGHVVTHAGDALVKMGMVSVKPLIFVMNNLHAVGPAGAALKELSKKHPEEVAAEIIAAVNGKFGEELIAVSTGNGMAVQNLSDILRECGEAMENAET